MNLPIGQQARAVNGIEERGGHLYFGFNLGTSANGTTLRKYYSYAELRAVPGNLDELCEKVAIYDWSQTTKELFQSPGHAYWDERNLYEGQLLSKIEAALREPPPVEQSAYRPAWEVNPCALVVWHPIIELSPALAANVSFAAGVEIVVKAA